MFDQKLFSYRCDKFDYPGSVLYLSCFVWHRIYKNSTSSILDGIVFFRLVLTCLFYFSEFLADLNAEKFWKFLELLKEVKVPTTPKGMWFASSWIGFIDLCSISFQRRMKYRLNDAVDLDCKNLEIFTLKEKNVASRKFNRDSNGKKVVNYSHTKLSVSEWLCSLSSAGDLRRI